MTIESEEFYNLCQAYRHAPIPDQIKVNVAYQELIKFIDAQLSTKQEWKPIETAPKDGTKVLLGRFVENCREGKNGHIKVDWWRQYKDKVGFIGWGEFNNDYWPATHWMPLPESPKP